MKVSLRQDFEASIVVFLVALPLCLGIALASGAPPMSGILAGIIGGVVVGALSKSQLSISGPAAGLTVIVAASIRDLGSFEVFLSAVVLAGIFQILLSTAKAGAIGYLFPNAVIKGMLSAIGLILIIKQIPHAFGVDTDYLGDLNLFSEDGITPFFILSSTLKAISPGALLVFIVTLASLVVTHLSSVSKTRFFRVLPSSLFSIVLGGFVSSVLISRTPWALQLDDLVSVPTLRSLADWVSVLHFPDFSQLHSLKLWWAAITIALVASLESLLSVCAVDKLDPHHRITPPSRELFAQGVGNLISGLLGALPITSVIVRSSANIEAGGQTNLSAIFHGIWLLICLILIPEFLNTIPIASLAALLVFVGYKLATPSLFRKMWLEGMNQFLPFFVCIIAILIYGLLKGVGIGLVVGLMFVIRENVRSAFFIASEGTSYIIKLQQKVTFVNKLRLQRAFGKIPDGSTVIIDGTRSFFIDHDVIDTIEEFRAMAPYRNIEVVIKQSAHALVAYFRRKAVA